MSTKDTKLILKDLAANGGTVVSSAACSEFEISLARATGRLYVDEHSCGFVLRPAAASWRPEAAPIGSPMLEEEGTAAALRALCEWSRKHNALIAGWNMSEPLRVVVRSDIIKADMVTNNPGDCGFRRVTTEVVKL